MVNGIKISWNSNSWYRGFKCSLTSAKCSFYRAVNAVFGKIGGRSSEDVILQLIRSKCIPALLYGLEACPLRSSDNNSLDFINRFYMKLFKTNNWETDFSLTKHWTVLRNNLGQVVHKLMPLSASSINCTRVKTGSGNVRLCGVHAVVTPIHCR